MEPGSGFGRLETAEVSTNSRREWDRCIADIGDLSQRADYWPLLGGLGRTHILRSSSRNSASVWALVGVLADSQLQQKVSNPQGTEDLDLTRRKRQVSKRGREGSCGGLQDLYD